MSAPAVDDPDERGSLSIADLVLEKLSAAAAGEVDGIDAVRGGLGARRRARVHHRGEHLDVDLTLEIAYPTPLPAAAEAARTRLRARVAELAELRVDRVDIDVAALPAPRPARTGRVVA